MIDYWVLDNGARLVSEEIPHLRSVAIGVYVGVGSRDEHEYLNGASHFIEHMLFKGTATRSAKDIAETFESIGGQLNAYTSKEYTCFYARTLDEHFDEATDILMDMVFNSAFNEREIQTEKGVVIEEIDMYEDSPDELIHDVFAQVMWHNHPLGRPILGTKATVGALDREQLMAYYRRFYVPANMVIAVAGNINNQKVLEKVTAYLKRASDARILRHKESPKAKDACVRLVSKETEQVQIGTGVPSISFLHDQRQVQSVMNSILGGGISSRLFQTIREEKGLAYSVFSYPSSYSDTGTFAVYVATGPDKIRDFFTVLSAEMEKFFTHGPTEEEVVRTQQQIKANIYLGLESVMNRMTRLGKSVLFYNRVIPVEEVMEQVMAVTPVAIRDFVQNGLAGKPFSLAAIGGREVLSTVKQEFEQRWTYEETVL